VVVQNGVYQLSTKSVDKTVCKSKLYRQNTRNLTVLLNRPKNIQEFKLLILNKLWVFRLVS